MHVAYEGHGLIFIGLNKNRQNNSCSFIDPWILVNDLGWANYLPIWQ
jgi:hypothetical protein